MPDTVVKILCSSRPKSWTTSSHTSHCPNGCKLFPPEENKASLTICRVCLRVCKQWQMVFTIKRHLWRSFECHRRPSNRALQKYFSWSGGDVRHMAIEADLDVSEWNGWLHMLMRGAPRLAHLDVRFGRRTEAASRLSTEQWPRSISTLIFDCFRGGDMSILPNNLTRLDLGNLDHLELPGRWPNLRCLCMRAISPAQWRIALSEIPQLEQLRIHVNRINLQPQSDLHIPSTTHLKVVVFHQSQAKTTFMEARLLQQICCSAADNLAHIDFALRLESLEKLALDHHFDEAQHFLIWVDVDDHFWTEMVKSMNPTSRNRFPNLRSFEIDRTPSHPGAAQHLLRASVENGTLRTFTICFSPLSAPAMDSRIGDRHCQWLEEYGWLKGAVCIRTMTIRAYFFSYLNSTQEAALPNFLGSFPNLEMLDFETWEVDRDHVCLLIIRIMRHAKKLKVIRTCNLPPWGPVYASLIAEAQLSGVEIVAERASREWPLRLEEQ